MNGLALSAASAKSKIQRCLTNFVLLAIDRFGVQVHISPLQLTNSCFDAVSKLIHRRAGALPTSSNA